MTDRMAMTGSTQTELPFASRGTAMQGGPKPGMRQAGNRRPWPGVYQAKGAEQEGRLLAARKKSQSYIRRSKIPPKTQPESRNWLPPSVFSLPE